MTPLQKLIDWIENTPVEKQLSKKDIKEKAESLLPEEKQMVIDAFEEGLGLPSLNMGEQYFNETFVKP